MTQYYFKVPFAEAGDVATIPLDSQPGGEVSYEDGFTVNYQLETDDPDVLYPERPVINELYRALTDAMRILQEQGFPDFITSTANDGSPFPYAINAFVRYSGKVYYSLEDNNEDTPPSSKWAEWVVPSGFKTGMTIPHDDITVPDGGWVWANGQTIGNASSGATGRANADTQALFTQIWNAFPNTVRPIQDSSGVATTRGVSAAADYAANKRIPLRDMRCVVPAGTSTMGGTSDRGLLTGDNAQGVNGSVFGATGGEQQHTQTTSEMPSHSHTSGTFNAASHNHVATSGVELGQTGLENTTLYKPGSLNGAVLIGRVVPITTSNATPAVSGTSATAGNGNPFNVVQPTTICNWITKL